jgi:uncharacterized protein (DUF2267 family)
MAAANYNHAIHRANVWLADVSDGLGTGDRQYAYRVLRTWLQTLRDRLTVESAAKFGQQLPELLRGVYYDGWEPSRVPFKHHAADYVRTFSVNALVPPDEVPGIAAAITDVITRHMSPGQVADAFAELPAELQATVRDGAPPRGEPVRAASSSPTLDDRVAALSEAVRTLARGLEDEHLSGQRIDPAQTARAARLAEEILEAAGR